MGISNHTGLTIDDSNFLLITGGTLTGLLTAQGNNLVVTQNLAKGILVTNTTLATNSVQVQMSPAFHWHGTGWNGSAGASRDVDVYADILPATTGSNPSVKWRLRASVNNAAYIDMFSAQLTPGSNSITIRMEGQFLATGAGTFNSIVNCNSTLSVTSTATVGALVSGQITSTNNITASGYIQANGDLILGGNFYAVGNGIHYDNTTKALSVGRNDTTHNATIEAKSQTTISLPNPTINSLGLEFVPLPPTSGVPTATEVSGRLDPPNGMDSFSLPANIAGAYSFGAGVTNYQFNVWSYDGSYYSAAPRVFTQDDGMYSPGDKYDLQIQANAPSVGSAVAYLVELLINGVSQGYKYLSMSTPPNENLYYLDNTGTGYSASGPSPQYNDYVANGQTLSYQAYGYTYDSSGTQYFETGNPYLNYSITLGSDGLTRRVQHQFSQSPCRVLGNPSATATYDYFHDMSSNQIEAPDDWTSGNTVTPNITGVAYFSDGSTLTRTYTFYNKQTINGVETFSSGASNNTTDPNNGNYYQPVWSITTSSPTIRVIRGVDGHAQDQPGSGTVTGYDTVYQSWADPTTVTPNTYTLPALLGEVDDANGTGLILQRASGQTARMAQFFEYDGTTFLSGFGPNYEWIPPAIYDASAPNNSLYYSYDQGKLSYKDPGGTVNPLY